MWAGWGADVAPDHRLTRPTRSGLSLALERRRGGTRNVLMIEVRVADHVQGSRLGDGHALSTARSRPSSPSGAFEGDRMCASRFTGCIAAAASSVSAGGDDVRVPAPARCWTRTASASSDVPPILFGLP